MMKWRITVFLLSLLPLAAMIWGAVHGKLGANPVEALSHESGSWALRFLLVTLAITPLRRLTGWRKLLSLRRMLGLFSFFYACLHFLVWLWLDQELDWGSMLTDIVRRPYVTVGFLSFLILMVLALTSNMFSMRRLGLRWKGLHRLVYVAALLAILHFFWLVKADLLQPLIYLGIFMLLMLLMLLRLPRKVVAGKSQRMFKKRVAA
ncbi:sulfite oxidase heme-binding subunit YedZ [Thiolapillus sp.]